MTPKDNRAEEGTTLLELLVALSLLALLSVYAIAAIRYLQNFDRVGTLIEERAGLEAARTHMRRALETMRVAFIVVEGTTPRLAFRGQRDAVTFVTHADSRLEHGGLYLVRFGLGEESSGRRDLMTLRRAFRPRMDMAMAGEGLLVLDKVAGLSFSYFGSPEEGVKPEWYDNWPLNNVLPQAIRIEAAFDAADPRRFPPLDIAIAVAK